MIITNYSKCPIRYYSNEINCKFSSDDLKFVVDYKCSAPMYTGEIFGIYDTKLDTLYLNYDAVLFKELTKSCDTLEYEIIYKCLYSTTKIDGATRSCY